MHNYCKYKHRLQLPSRICGSKYSPSEVIPRCSRRINSEEDINHSTQLLLRGKLTCWILEKQNVHAWRKEEIVGGIKAMLRVEWSVNRWIQMYLLFSLVTASSCCWESRTLISISATSFPCSFNRCRVYALQRKVSMCSLSCVCVCFCIRCNGWGITIGHNILNLLASYMKFTGEIMPGFTSRAVSKFGHKWHGQKFNQRYSWTKLTLKHRHIGNRLSHHYIIITCGRCILSRSLCSLCIASSRPDRLFFKTARTRTYVDQPEHGNLCYSV